MLKVAGLPVTTIALSVLAALLMSQHSLGLMLTPLLLLLTPWFAWLAWRACVKRSERRYRLLQIASWLLCGVAVFAVHEVRALQAQSYAEDAVRAIEGYIAKNGSCPVDLQAVGISAHEFHARLGYAGYACKDGAPWLFYRSIFDPFDTESYDFAHRTWMHFND